MWGRMPGLAGMARAKGLEAGGAGVESAKEGVTVNEAGEETRG